MKKALNIGFFISFIFVLTYSLIYITYKYSTPDLGGSDFYAYYAITVSPFNESATGSPFIYRQFGPLINHLIASTGITYNTLITFSNETINTENIYFSMILSNYIAIILTALVIIRSVEHVIKRNLNLIEIVFVFALFIFSFPILLFGLSGLQEAWSYFLLASLFLCYLKNNKLLFVFICALSIIQKETILIAICSFSFFSLTRDKEKNHKLVFFIASSFFAFLAYVLMRKYIFPVPGYESQLSPYNLMQNIFNFQLSMSIIFQGVLTMSPFIMIILVKLRYKMENDTFLTPLLATIASLFIIGIASGIGNNVGRVTMILAPICIFYISTLIIQKQNHSNL